MEEAFPLQCTVCNKVFNGANPAKHHYDSDKHKRKAGTFVGEETSKNIGLSFMNNLDDTSSVTSSEYNEFVNISNQMACLNLGIRTPSEAGSMIASTDTASSLGVSSSGAAAASTFGMCNLCNILYTSPEEAKKHLNGKKHLRKMKMVNLLPGANNVRADVTMVQSAPYSAPVPNPTVSVMASPTSPLGAGPQLLPVQAAHVVVETPSKRRRFCDICRCYVDTEEMYVIHCDSPSHVWKEKLFINEMKQQKKLKRRGIQHVEMARPADDGNNAISNASAVVASSRRDQQQHFCDTCSCYLNSAEQLKQHQESPRHITQDEMKKRNAFFLIGHSNDGVASTAAASTGPRSNPLLEHYLQDQREASRRSDSSSPPFSSAMSSITDNRFVTPEPSVFGDSTVELLNADLRSVSEVMRSGHGAVGDGRASSLMLPSIPPPSRLSTYSDATASDLHQSEMFEFSSSLLNRLNKE
ncbi:uncharacterized protein LOC141908261 [Tubulanus polymorphus]|uniref:uncharacterized protein LOC141908261 n=1 Tax=Tubulanus polymorphus TaxID=672921 RepID=UPI003DA58E2B